MATVYAPIAYPPLPLLAFKLAEGDDGRARLAATGALRSCDPDRIMLKKIVLSGYPVKASCMLSPFVVWPGAPVLDLMRTAEGMRASARVSLRCLASLQRA